MFPRDWTPPCQSCCTKKYAYIVQIPWRIFCKKGCNADGDTWDECIEACNEICYKDPVLKDHQWSAYIDRSPGIDTYSLGNRPSKARLEGKVYGVFKKKRDQGIERDLGNLILSRFSYIFLYTTKALYPPCYRNVSMPVLQAVVSSMAFPLIKSSKSIQIGRRRRHHHLLYQSQPQRSPPNRPVTIYPALLHSFTEYLL
ncbi:hypothetical protein KSP39_PZI008143 [Platanthera zijinensis]|uniref:Uncharacterized protein n=1 Tax=Platanthera zijinensis TaxID=2320716 RepID=A0AAP0BNJ3_9ASPA